MAKKKWIPKNLKKGRCTPLGNPDCRPGTPQYNLAKTFKKHHGFHKKKKETGGMAEDGKCLECGGKMKYGGIHIKKKNRGLLHKNLGVPQGEKIPASKLKIKSTDSPAVKKRKRFALNAKRWGKKAFGGRIKPNLSRIKKFK